MTKSQFPFRWWGAHPTLSDRHQLDEPSGPHGAEEGIFGASESRNANPRGYADSTRSAAFPTDGNTMMTRFAHPTNPGGDGACDSYVASAFSTTSAVRDGGRREFEHRYE
jgi:hypothetical protein